MAIEQSKAVKISDTRCATIIVNWRRGIDTIACIESLRACKGITNHLVVVENGSHDGSKELLRNYLDKTLHCDQSAESDSIEIYQYNTPSSTETITLICSNKNLGFAGGNNLGYKSINHQHYDYFWFLNNDTEILPDTLEQLLETSLADSKIGICGSTLIYAHDRDIIQALGGAKFNYYTGCGKERHNRQRLSELNERAHLSGDIDYISGASMLVSRQFIETVGLMCEDYFLYYEEIDWAVRGRKLGYKLGYAKNSFVYHKEGAVLGSGKSHKRSSLSEYYGISSRIKFTKKHFPFYLPIVYMFVGAQFIKRCFQLRWTNAAAIVRGLRGS